jgi:glycine cleavage system H lipoate-binding protein/ferredoxin
MKRGRRVRMVTACNFPIRDDKIEVQTRSERVLRARKTIVEFLLARCPGAKVVQDLAREMGIHDTPYPKENENCLLCGRCVAVCSEVVGAEAIGFTERGIFLKVGTPFGVATDACIGCGACTYVCPTGAIQMEEEARQRFRRLPGVLGLCRYARMGIIPYKVCPNDYECHRCEVDQFMEDTFGTHPALAVRPAGAKQAERIGEFILRPDVLYHSGHVWVRPLNGKVMMGLDDFAQRLVWNVRDISLQPAGSTVNRGDVAWDLKCGENKNAKMLFPFGGRITDVNSDVMNDPSLVRKDSYSRGWIYMMVPGTENYPENLMSRYVAKEWLACEADDLHGMMQGKAGMVMTDGGYLLEDLPKHLSNEEWNNLINRFFINRTE